jgi:hypothetical protein
MKDEDIHPNAPSSKWRPSDRPALPPSVKPMTLAEMMAWHKNNGTLREFLNAIGYQRDW